MGFTRDFKILFRETLQGVSIKVLHFIIHDVTYLKRDHWIAQRGSNGRACKKTAAVFGSFVVVQKFRLDYDSIKFNSLCARFYI